MQMIDKPLIFDSKIGKEQEHNREKIIEGRRADFKKEEMFNLVKVTSSKNKV